MKKNWTFIRFLEDESKIHPAKTGAQTRGNQKSNIEKRKINSQGSRRGYAERKQAHRKGSVEGSRSFQNGRPRWQATNTEPTWKVI